MSDRAEHGKTAFYCFSRNSWGIDGEGMADSVEDVVVTMLELNDGREVNCIRAVSYTHLTLPTKA